MDFARMILENLKTSGVQHAQRRQDYLYVPYPWPGDLVCDEGRYIEGGKETGKEKRAAIFIEPEFGTVSRPDLVQAAREAGDAGFDVLITCAFNYGAHSSEFSKLGRIQVLKARMNADLQMADDLKNTTNWVPTLLTEGEGNIFHSVMANYGKTWRSLRTWHVWKLHARESGERQSRRNPPFKSWNRGIQPTKKTRCVRMR